VNKLKDLVELETPITLKNIQEIEVGDRLELSGVILTGRDAALPKLVSSIKKGQPAVNIQGMVIMHTAVSDAGISPTTSNKDEIEESIPFLSKEGVRIHLGKGALSEKTVDALNQFNSIYAVTPPAAALLTSKVKTRRVAAFEEEGMEAIHALEVSGLPCIVASAHGKTIY
jgi:fumarate hydratase subunit beta